MFSQIKPIDTLNDKSFDDLMKIFYQYKNVGDTESGKKIALYTLRKARLENNKKAIVNSFIRLCRVSYDTPEIALKYTDSSIYYASKYNLTNLKAEGHFYKGLVLFEQGRYGASLTNYLEANKYYHNKENEMHYVLNHNIALLKLKIGSSREALEIFKKNLTHYEKEKSYNHLYLSTLYGLSIAYSSNNNKDSASIINKKGYVLARNTRGYNHLYFTQAEGAIHYIKGNYREAKDSLSKSISFLKTNKDYPNLAISYFYLGSIAEDENEKINYYKKVDSIFREKKYIIPTPRKAYEGLINHYKNKGDLQNQLYYTNRLLVIDTVINKEYRNVSRTFHYEYDTPRLIADKELLISKLNKENEGFKYGIFILITTLLFMALLLILLYRKKKLNESRFSEIITSLQTKSDIEKVSLSKEKKRKSYIDQDTLDEILKGLNDFEQNKAFLTPKLTLNSFAKKLNTNTKYLSIVINDYKSQTFKNYVNNLRIEYIVEKLYSNEILRNYTISAIASEAGFSSTESFTRAFNKKTGINVSYFLKKIND